jgi:hypothetical protein
VTVPKRFVLYSAFLTRNRFGVELAIEVTCSYDVDHARDYAMVDGPSRSHRRLEQNQGSKSRKYYVKRRLSHRFHCALNLTNLNTKVGEFYSLTQAAFSHFIFLVEDPVAFISSCCCSILISSFCFPYSRYHIYIVSASSLPSRIRHIVGVPTPW